mmetsp:Transcript_19156/g.46000  ORF Transcript_19156/g.46000 Transcript_19156/m.46000 type:complete len:96 (+) Transcript_19156:877-1164(+)
MIRARSLVPCMEEFLEEGVVQFLCVDDQCKEAHFGLIQYVNVSSATVTNRQSVRYAPLYHAAYHTKHRENVTFLPNQKSITHSVDCLGIYYVFWK